MGSKGSLLPARLVPVGAFALSASLRQHFRGFR